LIKRKIQRVQSRHSGKPSVLKKIHLGDPSKNLYELGRIFLLQLQKDNINERAGSMAFSFTIALFPTFDLPANLIPYMQDFFPYITTQNILNFVAEILPGEIYAQD